MYKLNSGLAMALGNRKLDDLIFNMGSATQCPSMIKGFCKLGLNCYALKAEKMYPACLPSRVRQESYWLNNSAKKIADDILTLAAKHKRAFRNVTAIRFNEAGDFHSQACVDKLDKVAGYVRAVTGWMVYGFTARKDLDFSKVVSFLVKGSSHDAGNNGTAIARHPKYIEAYEQSSEYYVCPGSCRKCSVCKQANGANVVFPLH